MPGLERSTQRSGMLDSHCPRSTGSRLISLPQCPWEALRSGEPLFYCSWDCSGAYDTAQSLPGPLLPICRMELTKTPKVVGPMKRINSCGQSSAGTERVISAVSSDYYLHLKCTLQGDNLKKPLCQARCPFAEHKSTWIFLQRTHKCSGLVKVTAACSCALSPHHLGHAPFLPPSSTILVPPFPCLPHHHLALPPFIPADLITPMSPSPPPEDKGGNCLHRRLLT